MEETGYEALELRRLSSYYLDSGQKNSVKHLFHARCEKVPVGKPENTITVEIIPFEHLFRLAREGVLKEPSVALAILMSNELRR